MIPKPAITTEYSFNIHWTEVTLGTETEIEAHSFDGLIQKLSELSKCLSVTVKSFELVDPHFNWMIQLSVLLSPLSRR